MKDIDKDLLKLNGQQLRKHHLVFYNTVMDYTDNVYVSDVEVLTFRERLYVYHNELTIRPVCKWCKGKINFWKFDKGYKQFCSNKCSGNYK